jgi:thiol:disulfide interchange protein DsbG
MVALGGISGALAVQQAKARTLEQVAESVLSNIDQATWVAEGSGSRIVYIFFDPNCPYCHRLYLRTRHWVKEDKLQLRWIPVGILTTTSRGKAAAILAAKDPIKAFYNNEDHYEQGGEMGAIEEELLSPDLEKKLDANEALLASARLGGVPVMVFRADNDAAIVIQGAPPQKRLDAILRHVK